MPARRATIQRGRSRITPAAIEAYRTKDGRAIRGALGIKLWEMTPFDVAGRERDPPDPDAGHVWEQSYFKARTLRDELEAALELELSNGDA
jgi:hypothetical protein